jgi:peptide/nickel transport system permease protein
MTRYIVKRLISMLPVILGIMLLIFSILSFTSGDPARMILGEDASIEDVEVLRESLGLNDPFLIRFLNYTKGALRIGFHRR